MTRVSKVAWDWAAELADYQISWYLSLISDDLQFLPDDYTKALLWRASMRLKQYEEANRNGLL